MAEIRKHLDPWSMVVIAVTLGLFVVALFLKGVGHDVLVEGGVFLVSVKLILMAYRNSIAAAELRSRLDNMETTLGRLESLLRQRQSSGSPPE